MRIEHRAIELDTRDQDGTFPVTVSTETPVDRGRYWEVLDHRDGQVDLTRIPLPLIESHDTQRVNVGLIENAKLVSGQLKGHARLGASERARELVKDITAKIVRFLSVGYQLLDEGTPIGERDGKPVLRFRWMPYEASIVSVPADINAGFFRSQIMSTENTADRAVAAERERVKEINAIADRFRDRIEGVDALRAEAISANTTVDAFRASMLDKLPESGSINTESRSFSMVSATGFLTGKERAKFQITNVVEAAMNPRRARDIAGFELEVCDEAARRAGRAIEPNRICIPHEVFAAPARRDLTVGTSTAGGHLVATDLLAGSFIDLLRNEAAVLAAGATVISDLVGNVAIPRQTSAATVQWVAENSAPSESQQAFDQVTLTPKTVAGFVDMSRRLQKQSTPAIEQIVRADLTRIVALAIDAAAINGTGTSNQPTGIMNTAGVGSVAGGTNGAAPTWDNLVDLDTAIANANAMGERRFITNSKVAGKLRRTQMFSGTNGMTVWQASNEQIAPVLVSNQVPSNLTKGTSSGVCSAIITGVWSELLIGMWGTLDMLIDPYTGGTAGTVRIIVLQDVDIAVRHAASFALMSDALTT